MSENYSYYLDAHINAVKRAADWMVRNLNAVKVLPYMMQSKFLINAAKHDASKRDACEYGPYDAYFYGEKDEDSFNYAWLHHIHNNPHHWQYWLLMNDDGKYRDPDKVVVLEMPREYALEMVADWWSFSWRSGNLKQIFDWYEEHKDSIILHPNTREFVESVLNEIRYRISE